MERHVAAVTRKLEAVLQENAELHRQRQQLVASGVAQEVRQWPRSTLAEAGSKENKERKQRGKRKGERKKNVNRDERSFFVYVRGLYGSAFASSLRTLLPRLTRSLRERSGGKFTSKRLHSAAKH